MITKDTIEKIFDSARIDEVVGDFVTLKKRGANLLGVCPFHNEKTPSFTVSPAKGIYKCFGCGKAGNSVDFIMNHEQLTYPEALRFLAKKYNIQIEEDQQAIKEDPAIVGEKEAIFAVTEFAAKYYKTNLHDTDEGKSVGLSYFRDRGFTDATIEKFQLGYSYKQWRGFTDAAIEAGFKLEYLVKAGLTIQHEENKIFDRFTARVIFPIHNISGRVIGFGGRTLVNDKKVAKYINSPETEIYHKTNVLYGLFHARKAIVADDNCVLTEGYADVISLHQAGIETAVASSGTSLTPEQVRLIRRYTKNVTILYDADPAGIKASLRGIDIMLEEGMNVKVLLLPEGEDPDSFSQKLGRTELKEYIGSNSTDFISFKTKLLYAEAKHDPLKKAALIGEIVQSVALIPDAITRTIYLRECSRIMEIEEQVLIAELNKVSYKKLEKQQKEDVRREASQPLPEINPQADAVELKDNSYHQEKDVIRLLLNYGDKKVMVEGSDEPFSAAEFIFHLLNANEIQLKDPVFNLILSEYEAMLQQSSPVSFNTFTTHHDPQVARATAEMLATPYNLSPNWEKFRIFVTHEDSLLKSAIESAVYSLTLKRIMEMIITLQKTLNEDLGEEKTMETLEQLKELQEVKKTFSAALGRVIV